MVEAATGSIPLPLYQPEVVDTTAVFTEELNVSLGIFGVRQKVQNVRAGSPKAFRVAFFVADLRDGYLGPPADMQRPSC